MTTKDRIKLFAKEKGFGRNKFEKHVGIASGYLSSKSSSVTSDTIEKIYEKFPELNLEWLITGQGNMIKNSIQSFFLSHEFSNETEKNIQTQTDSININNLFKIINNLAEYTTKNTDAEIIRARAELIRAETEHANSLNTKKMLDMIHQRNTNKNEEKENLQ